MPKPSCIRTIGLAEPRATNAGVIAGRLVEQGVAVVGVADRGALAQIAESYPMALAIVAVEREVELGWVVRLIGLGVPVLAILPSRAEGLAVAALAAGADAAMTKPMALDRLAAEAGRLIDAPTVRLPNTSLAGAARALERAWTRLSASASGAC